MTTFIIYKHTSPSGKSYIGKTKFTIEKQWKEHISMTEFGKNHKIHQAIRKYKPENFTSEVIVSNVPDWAVNAFEKYWINYYDTYRNGYNMTEGGEGRTTISEEQKEAIRKHNSTRVLSEETLDKMRKSAKGRVYSQEVYDKASRSRSKLTNLYDYYTKALIAENIYLFEWCRDNPKWNRKRLADTARGDRNQHKGIYAVYIT